MKLSQMSLAVAAVLAASFAAQASEVRRPYVVQLAAAPAASYTGGVAGFAATKPAAGQKLDVDASAVQNYLGYLDQVHSNVLAAVPAVEAIHQFNLVFNGFTAMLTDAEVRALKKNSSVAQIQVDEPHELTTNYTPAFLSLDAADGIWAKAGGQGAAGEDIIIGIIDSGVSPENPAFADRVDADGIPTFDLGATQVFGPAPAKWKGECSPGEGFSLSNCNNKLIGAQFFDATYRSVVAQGLYTPHWSDFKSPRDNGGHGTHTATTAGGNANVMSNVNGVAMGKASGIAPRARIAAYKVCWSYQDPANVLLPKNSCFTGDNVAAIEKAVKDGVDVLNYSISGSQTSVNDAVELAFLGATNAGVFVSASAGNSGPGNAVAHLGPWLTTVGASTHDRFNAGNVILGNGASYEGGSLNGAALAASTFILARDAAKEGANLTNAALCFGSADGVSLLDPLKVAGKVVVCDRGSNVLVNKSQAVKETGGIGIVIGNVLLTNNTITSIDHGIPAVHIDKVSTDAVKAYLATEPAATLAMSKFAAKKGTVAAPVMAAFSSRGPNRGYPNILKPDLTAPGVEILAGYTPTLNEAQRNDVANGAAAPAAWNFLQGTSMSSPHIAGLGALLKQQYPNWTPAMIKSALMTTGSMTFADAQPGQAAGQLPWAQGAGHVVPNKAAVPGLVYDIQPVDYTRYLCSISLPSIPQSTCNAVGKISDVNLNLPSITLANVLGKTTVTRTVTHVGTGTATYTASSSIPGFSIDVVPATLTLAPGQSASFTATVTRTSAALNTWAFGSLKWTDGATVVSVPVSAKGTGLAAASALYSENVKGNILYTVGTGFAGAMTSQVGGLKAATVKSLTIGQATPGTIETSAQLAAACLSGAKGTVLQTVVAPANTLVLKAATYNAETSGHSMPGGDDIDMVLMNPANTVVATSLRAGSDEEVQLMTPAAGTYKVCLGGYGLASGTQSDFNLSTWAVTTADKGGNFKLVLPGSATIGGSATTAVSWSGLATGKRYMAAIRYIVAGSVQGTTLVRVETNDPLPEVTRVKPVVVAAN
ncbi:S8 family peptidase [Rheinheimera riviphila]|uniref:S8 family peptidase n=1 Tax=Rheinheimera riviphila TaxID=1834037 RepID=A0A437QT36_9GAMM|nr:S8 family serine peptidase [Rheinheimera riviphila]RVU37688.1 S8 family peptidase [Rheinheimera riviphila]